MGVVLGGSFCESEFRLRDGSRVAVRHPPNGGLGYMPWPAAFSLARYLDDHADALGLNNRSAIELGSGAHALVGRVAARLCRTAMLTDTSELIPELIEVSRNAPHPRPDVRQLNWLGIWTTDAMYRPGEFDLVLMSDVVYFPHLYRPLLVTLLALCDESTTLLWANCDIYPDYGRPEITQFLDLAAPFFTIAVLDEKPQEDVGAPPITVTPGGRVCIFELHLRDADKARGEVELALRNADCGGCLKRIIP